VTTHPI